MGRKKPYVVGHTTKLELEDEGDNEDYKSYSSSHIILRINVQTY